MQTMKEFVEERRCSILAFGRKRKLSRVTDLTKHSHKTYVSKCKVEREKCRLYALQTCRRSCSNSEAFLYTTKCFRRDEWKMIQIQ
jgi:hypothetical protein